VAYSFSVYGPNGFFREFRGDITGNAAQVEVDAIYTVTRSGDGVAGPGIILQLRNADAGPREITIHDGYAQKTEALTVAAGATEKKAYPLDASSGWYDLLVAVDGDAHFQRHIAGHVETGSDSVTDPAIGKA
jgi:phospholipase C